jgi:hypothetical protein
MQKRRSLTGAALFVAGVLCGVLAVAALGPSPVRAQAELRVQGVRLEALVPVPAAAGSRGIAVIPRNAAQIKFHCELSGQTLGTVARGVWIAEDVGAVAPPNFTIDDSSELLLESSPVVSTFSLSQPETGWPVGNYRFEVRVADSVVHTERFIIE